MFVLRVYASFRICKRWKHKTACVGKRFGAEVGLLARPYPLRRMYETHGHYSTLQTGITESHSVGRSGLMCRRSLRSGLSGCFLWANPCFILSTSTDVTATVGQHVHPDCRLRLIIPQ